MVEDACQIRLLKAIGLKNLAILAKNGLAITVQLGQLILHNLALCNYHLPA